MKVRTTPGRPIVNTPRCNEGERREQPLERLHVTPEQLARVARGLAHPSRIAILSQLASGESRTTGDIVTETGLAQSTVSEHLRFLRDAELLAARKDGARIWYCLRPDVIHGFADALHDLANTH